MELIVLFALIFFTALFSFRHFRAKRRLSFIENYQFPEVIRSKLKEQYPSLSDEQVASVLLALKSYFRMSHVGKMNMVAMPSRIVDAAWHEFILFTKSYQQFCSKAFGKFLHHTPTEAMKTKTTAQEGIKRAWKTACSLDQINPKKPNKLPLIFSIDSDLQITNGYYYSLNCKSRRSPNGDYCASHIGCSSSFSGSFESDSSCGSSCSSGCGGGD